MPSIFEAPKVRKVPVRDFHAKRVISLLWNADVMDDRLDQLIAFATTHTWASADPYDFKDFSGASAQAGPDRRPEAGRRHPERGRLARPS
jgi:hypothetical protein